MTTMSLLRTVLVVLALAAGRVWAQAEDPVSVASKASKTKVAPGDTFAVAVVFDIEKGWHLHPNAPVLTPGMAAEQFTPIPTTIEASPLSGLTVWPVQWPKTSPTKVIVSPRFGRETYGAYEGRAVAFVPVQVPSSAQAGSSIHLGLKISYQTCDERNCMLPQDLDQSVDVPVVTLAEAAGASVQKDADFDTFDPGVFASAPGGGPVVKKASTVRFSAFGLAFEIDPAGAGFVLLLLVAAFGGLLLNFTPCVLPVVPLKIMGLSQAAGNPARCFYLGAVMSLGVVAFWVAIGAAIAFVSGFSAISSLFQTPWFSLAVGLFILVMSIGMLGLYTVRLPQAVYMINPSHESAGGSFVFGIMTAVLSTPCTAPFMGSAAAWAATQRAPTTLSTFGAIGFGMALPYLVLSAFPKLLSRLPRTGPASELIKQVMGLLLVAVALFFLGTGLDPLLRLPVDPPFRAHWWGIAAAGIGAMAWLVYRTFRITKRAGPRVVWTVLAALGCGATLAITRAVTQQGPIPWLGYTPERLAEQLSKKKVVVLDFTAEWCLNCKALEAGVLHRPEIVKILTGPDVVPMRVDLTGSNPPGKQKLKELQWVGIPLLAIYGPGVGDPITYDAYTPEMVRDAIARASGKPGLVQAPPR
jgi:thiol:disulfide interchange protein DsbD